MSEYEYMGQIIEPCPNCGGYGEVIIIGYNDYDYDTCPICHGLGNHPDQSIPYGAFDLILENSD